MLMDVSHLSMKERLALWKERKKSCTAKTPSSSAAASSSSSCQSTPTRMRSSSAPTFAPSPSVTKENSHRLSPNSLSGSRRSSSCKSLTFPAAGGSGYSSDSKFARKRTRKYINSTIPSRQNPSTHVLTSKQCCDLQKRTKKENDNPNFAAKENASAFDANKTDPISDIEDDMKNMSMDGGAVCDEHETSQHETSDLSLPDSEIRLNNKALQREIKIAKHEQKEALKIAKMSVEENATLKFEIEIMSQTIDSLETELNQTRMQMFETDDQSEQLKDQQKTIRNLERKGEEDKKRVDDVVNEMTEMMTRLQEEAMQRIQQLENDLMLEQHKTQAQEATIAKLKQAQDESEEVQKRRIRRRKTRRRSHFIDFSNPDGSSSDSTQEARLSEDDTDETSSDAWISDLPIET